MGAFNIIDDPKDLVRQWVLGITSRSLVKLWEPLPEQSPLRSALIVFGRDRLRRGSQKLSGALAWWMLGFAAAAWAIEAIWFPALWPAKFAYLILFPLLLAYAKLKDRMGEEEREHHDKAMQYIAAHNQFVRAIDQVHKDGFSKLDSGALKKLSSEFLIGIVIDVRKIERDGAGIDQEHWIENKRKRVKELEFWFNAFARLRLADQAAGLGPIYEQADARLKKLAPTAVT